MNQSSATLRQSSLEAFVKALAQRKPTPGGGSAAAIVGAQACGLAAMACRYTTGKRWPQAEQAELLAVRLDAAADRLLALAEADIAAFQEVQARTSQMKNASEEQLHDLMAEARMVPETVLSLTCEMSVELAGFLPKLNPQLRVDAVCALHLLQAAARSAWRLFLVNRPYPSERADTHRHLQTVQEIGRKLDEEAHP